MPGVIETFASTLREGGLDLFQPFSVAWFNERAPEEHRLPTFEQSDALGVVVGNSRALWQKFLRHRPERNGEDSRHPDPDPLDDYVEHLVDEGLRRVRSQAGPLRTSALYAHQTQPRPIAIQHMAHAVGLAHLGPAHLSVHHRFGPWIALRAVVCFGLSTEALPSDPAPNVCAGCDAPCRRALSFVRRNQQVPPELAHRTPPPTLSREKTGWLAVRDACPIGRDYRYGEGQILYHYDKQREALLQND